MHGLLLGPCAWILTHKIVPPDNDGHNPRQAVCPSFRFYYPEKIIYLDFEFVSSGKLKKNWNFCRLVFLPIRWTSECVWKIPHIAGCPLPSWGQGTDTGWGRETTPTTWAKHTLVSCSHRYSNSVPGNTVTQSAHPATSPSSRRIPYREDSLTVKSSFIKTTSQKDLAL